MTWKPFPHYWIFLKWVYHGPVNSPYKGSVIWSICDFFVDCLNKLSGEHSSCQLFGTPCCSCDIAVIWRMWSTLRKYNRSIWRIPCTYGGFHVSSVLDVAPSVLSYVDYPGTPCHTSLAPPLIARFMGPTWGPSGAGRTQMGPMLAPCTLLSGLFITATHVVVNAYW